MECKVKKFKSNGGTIACDLIETLWNVKFFPGGMGLAQWTGFNRDIVECKAVKHRFDITRRTRI